MTLVGTVFVHRLFMTIVQYHIIITGAYVSTHWCPSCQSAVLSPRPWGELQTQSQDKPPPTDPQWPTLVERLLTANSYSTEVSKLATCVH